MLSHRVNYTYNTINFSIYYTSTFNGTYILLSKSHNRINNKTYNEI